MKRTVSDFEQEKNADSSQGKIAYCYSFSYVFLGIKWMDENARKKVLETFDTRDKMTRSGSFQRERHEISELRKSRKHIGCGCKGGSPCITKKCACLKNEIPCNESSCECDPNICGNPRVESLDQDTIDEFRQEKLKEANLEFDTDSEQEEEEEEDDE